MRINNELVLLTTVSTLDFGYQCTLLAPQLGWPTCSTISVQIWASSSSIEPVGATECWEFYTTGCEDSFDQDGRGSMFY
ncbi:hypothetical protein J7M28_04815 [bacterium]|nr:hypothetical protein [bacterium]